MANAPVMTQRSDGGFNFTDAAGSPISARTYAAQSGTPFYDLLTTMASKGDTGAGTFLQGFVAGPGNLADDANTANNVGSNLSYTYPGYGDIGNALTWENAKVATGGPGGTDSADEAAYWGDQMSALQRLLQSTETQKGQGLTRIDQSYDAGVGATNQKADQGLRDYATKRQDTMTDKVGAFGNINSNARNAFDSLTRLLGLGNAGVSSAAQIVAPNAVAREATQQRTRANDTFGRNIRDITTKEDDFKIQVAQALDDLLNQKKSKTEDFLRGIFQQELGINQSLSDAATQKTIASGGNYRTAAGARSPFQSRVADIQSTLDSLFGQYGGVTFNAQPIEAKAPDLAQYLVDPVKVASQNANPNIDQSLLPFLAQLKEKDQNVGLI